MISQLNEQLRRIVISGQIKEETAALFLEQITAFEYIDMVKPITIYIDSPGGDLYSALGMYDAIKSCVTPIVTVGVGKVMSAAVLLLGAGDRGSRFITENSRVMLHEVGSGVIGPLSELQNSVIETKKMQDMFIDILARDSDNTKEKILGDMKVETFMSASAAVKYGIADKMVSTKRVIRKKRPSKPAKKKSAKKKTTKPTRKKK